MLVLHHKPDHMTGDDPAVAFIADNVQRTYDELRAKGIEFTQPPKTEPWDEYATFKDSEGNQILFAKGQIATLRGMATTMPITLRQIMTTQVVTVSMDDGLRVVRQLFDQHHFHHLLVVEGAKLVGVISDRDLLRHVSVFLGHNLAERSQDMATLNKRAHQVMTRQPIFARPDTTIQQAVALILEHRISCLPVVDENLHPVGIVTWRDILKTLATDQASDPT